ncbi:SET domain-containing protein [Corynespora cassiicola Philippines]|uniref:SET domain-containing protein n=1 Tax=Corynespora cassiicola Philippines TaxID=1448308 RepID=A0A2T2NJ53_CORCC|nr:SET domain-containing protein [Corynespora cassiicola Philippines]
MPFPNHPTLPPATLPLLCALFTLPSQTSATTFLLPLPSLLTAHQHSLSTSPNPYSPHTPWSHAPICHHASGPSPAKYCAYTSNTTGALGFTAITTPARARSAASAMLAENPAGVFLSHLHGQGEGDAAWPFDVVAVPGKGMGVVATRRIARLEVLMVDRAVLVVDLDIEEEMRDRGKRINHACTPNAFVLFSPTGLSVAVKAYRDIEPGEEITISYLLLGQPHASRSSTLARWGFSCTCALCALDPAARLASDARRELIQQSAHRILGLWREGKVHDAISLAKKSAELIIEEDVWPLLTDEYALLARLSLAVGEREEAEEYGRMCWELLRDLGFLGEEEEEEEWSLEGLLEMLGGRGMYG